MIKPNLFIAGAPKCGTTSLCNYLDEHPQVFISKPKEPLFFGSDMDKKNRMSQKDYVDLFSGSTNEKWKGEGSTWYMFSELAANEIHAFNANSKIIMMIRNPFEVVLSLYSQRKFDGAEDSDSLYEALQLETQRLDGNKIPLHSTIPKQKYMYSKVPLFSEQLQRFSELFGEENVLTIIHDDLKADTLGVLKRVYDFLEIEDNPNLNAVRYNENKVNKNQDLRKVMNNENSLLRKLGSAILPASLRAKIYSFVVKQNSIKAKRSPMSTQVFEYLKPSFTEEVKKLEKTLNRDLSHWLHEKN